MAKALSYSMVVALRDVEKSGDPYRSAYGMSERGGRTHTIDALLARGLINRIGGRHEYELTDTGKTALEERK